MAKRLIVTDNEGDFAEPSLTSKVLRGAQMLNPKRAAMQLYENPKARAALVSGLRGEESGTSPEEQALNLGGRYGLPTLATSLLPGAAIESAVARAVGGQGLRALVGKTAGLGARMGAAGASAGLAALAGSIATGAPGVEQAGETAKEFATGEGIGKGLEVGVPAAWRGAKAVGMGGLERASALFSKISPGSWETLRKFPERTAAYARQGMTRGVETGQPIAKAMQYAQDLGGQAQEYIEKAAEGAGKRFEQMMGYLKEDESTLRFKGVAEKVYDKMEPFIEQQTAYRSGAQSETTKAHAKVFNHFYDRIRNTLQEGMAPGEVADLLQQMTLEQRTHKGTALAAHLESLKDAVLGALPRDYHVSTEMLQPVTWNIKDTRAEYRAAKNLQRETAGFVRKENPVSSFDRIMSAGGRTARALKRAMKTSPELTEKLAGMEGAKAGAEFAPLVSRELPRTGLIGAAILTPSRMLAGDAAAAAEMGAMAVGASPRLAMETYLGASKASRGLERLADAAPERAIPAGLGALLHDPKEKKKKRELP